MFNALSKIPILSFNIGGNLGFLTHDKNLLNSETDSEVIAHLLSYQLRTYKPKDAIKNTLKFLEGAFAIAILFKNFIISRI